MLHCKYCDTRIAIPSVWISKCYVSYFKNKISSKIFHVGICQNLSPLVCLSLSPPFPTPLTSQRNTLLPLAWSMPMRKRRRSWNRLCHRNSRYVTTIIRQAPFDNISKTGEIDGFDRWFTNERDRSEWNHQRMQWLEVTMTKASGGGNVGVTSVARTTDDNKGDTTRVSKP